MERARNRQHLTDAMFAQQRRLGQEEQNADEEHAPSTYTQQIHRTYENISDH